MIDFVRLNAIGHIKMHLKQTVHEYFREDPRNKYCWENISNTSQLLITGKRPKIIIQIFLEIACIESLTF